MAEPQVAVDDPQPLFEPPPDGDLIIRSYDGTEFHVHSLILKLASPIFRDMFNSSLTKDPVVLCENAVTISLVLQFIYPNAKRPGIPTIDMLSSCLEMADKYDMDRVTQDLDEQISSSDATHDFLSDDPIRIYSLAIQFNLTKTKAAAGPLVAASECDFCEVGNLPLLIDTHPSPVLFRVLALKSTRARILADVLFDFSSSPMSPLERRMDTFYYDLSCSHCQSAIDNCPLDNRHELYEGLPPSWVLAWARLVYEHLLTTPLGESEEMFEANVLLKLEGARNVCQHCLSDFWRVKRQRPKFNSWARLVRDVLEERLDELEDLYSL